MTRFVPIFALALLLSATSAANAQSNDDAARCTSISGNPDLAIQHCTRAIESGRHAGDELARLHYNRAIEWAAKGEHDRAIADYDTAIRINPRNADAFYNRGNALGSKGEHDRAIADFETAIRLAPKDPAPLIGRAFELTVKGDYARALADYDAALRLDPKASGALLARGRVRLYSGDYPRAIADLEQSFKLEPNEYTALWLYFARKRAGAADAEERLDRETRPMRGSWPTAVVILFLGRTDPDSVIAAATDPDAARQREQRCEANFYLAQWHLLRGNRERGLALLQQAQRSCPREFLEYEGAVAELRRLQR